MKKRLVAFSGVALLALAGQAAAQDRAAMNSLVTGVGAKISCSAVFVSGRSLEAAAADSDRLLGALGGGIDYAVDREAASASASREGVSRSAYYRPGLGCTLSVDGQPLPAQADPRDPYEARPVWRVAEPGPDVDAAALTAAMDAAFPTDADVDTRAFVVVHHGRIVAERYAEGFDADMPLLGWSMSKSVIATLIGLLIEDGRLSLDDTLDWPGWPDGDPRGDITVEQLLHMSSGLAFSEDYAGADDATLMLFTQNDMAAYAASKPAAAPPDTVWSYSSGTTLILSRLLIEVLGSPEAVQAYARERLFVPAGMLSAVLEQDGAGTPVGSSYVYASARDWARFGQLYLNGGEIGGRRILSPEWTAWVQQPAPADPTANYGGQFWLNGWRSPDRARRSMADLPPDAFSAIGHNGQTVMIIPSLDVVIVRLGWTTGDANFRMSTTAPPVLRALGILPAADTTP